MKTELLNIFSRFQKELKEFRVVVMPDFFVDTILSGSYNYNFDKFREKINSGGGSIRKVSHFDRVGGNAVNVAHALGKIGVATTLSTISEDKYIELINY